MRDLKKSLRSQFLSIRDNLPPGLRALYGARILATLRSDPRYIASRLPAFTFSIGSEVDTRPLLRERWAKGLPVLVPRVHSDGMMEFYRLGVSPDALAVGDFGIPTPDPSRDQAVDPKEIDLLVPPGVAFDPWGNRLGRGGGFFDRYLTRLPEATPRIGLAYECQMVESVPREDWDIPVRSVITERTVYEVQRLEWISHSPEETHALAASVARRFDPPGMIRLSGELGAGKTEWVRGFLAALGWEKRVRSPTFDLEHVYDLPGCRVYHLDGYRLVSPSLVDRERLGEILDNPGALTLIEWPERFGPDIPPFASEIRLARVGEMERVIRWTAFERRRHLR